MKYQILQEAGLNKNEVLAYEKLLDFGELTPPQVAFETKLSRENAYNVLASLLDKNLIEEVPRRKKKTYRPQPPIKLQEFIENKRKTLEETEKAIEAIIPDLTNVYNLTTTKPSISYFEGVEGIKKIYEDTLRGNPEETLVIRSGYDDEVLGKYLFGFLKRRAARGIKNRIINPKGLFIGAAGTDKQLLRKRKELDLHIPTEITIYKNKVSIINLRKDKTGVIIESPDFAETFKNIFEYIWKK